MLELLPSLNAYVGGNWDSNSFLFNQNWLSYGAKISWNLMNAFRYPARLQVIDAQKEVLDVQSLALTMTIMTQVHVAAAQYEAALRRSEIDETIFRYPDENCCACSAIMVIKSLKRTYGDTGEGARTVGRAALRDGLGQIGNGLCQSVGLRLAKTRSLSICQMKKLTSLRMQLQERWEWLAQHATVSKLQPESSKTWGRTNRRKGKVQERGKASKERRRRRTAMIRICLGFLGALGDEYPAYERGHQCCQKFRDSVFRLECGSRCGEAFRRGRHIE